MFNAKGRSYLKSFSPFLFMFLQLLSIAIAIAFPVFILLPFLVSILSATLSFTTIYRSNTKTAAAFLVVSVALSILTWGAASIIMQYGLSGFMHLLISGPLLLSTIGGLSTGVFFALYHFYILYGLAPKETSIKNPVSLIRSLVPAVIMGCLAFLFGVLVLNIMPLALTAAFTSLALASFTIPALAICGWLAGNFLGLIGVNQLWIADRIGRGFAFFSAAPNKWRDLLCRNDALFFPSFFPSKIQKEPEASKFTIEDEEEEEGKKEQQKPKQMGETPPSLVYPVTIPPSKICWTTDKIARGFLFFSSRPSKELSVLFNGQFYMPRPNSTGSNYAIDDSGDGMQTHPAMQVTLSFNSPTGCPTCN